MGQSSWLVAGIVPSTARWWRSRQSRMKMPRAVHGAAFRRHGKRLRVLPVLEMVSPCPRITFMDRGKRGPRARESMDKEEEREFGELPRLRGAASNLWSYVVGDNAAVAAQATAYLPLNSLSLATRSCCSFKFSIRYSNWPSVISGRRAVIINSTWRDIPGRVDLADKSPSAQFGTCGPTFVSILAVKIGTGG